VEERGIPTIVAKRLDGSRFKMPLGKEVGLGPGRIVLDGDQWGPTATTAAPPHSWAPARGSRVGNRPPWQKSGWAMPTLEILTMV